MQFLKRAPKTSLWILLVCSIITSSCSKGDDQIKQPDLTTKVDIYVGGNISDATGKTVATIWKNGVATQLTGGAGNSTVRALFVVDKDIYAAGITTNGSGKQIATIWENGIATQLTKGITNDIADDIIVDGADVYVSGKQGPLGMIWKNSSKFYTFDDQSITRAISMYMDGKDLYITGPKSNGHSAYWVFTNTGKEEHSLSQFGFAMSIFVDGKDVHIASGTGEKGVYIKNGKEEPLSVGTGYSAANSLVVADGNVYIGGWMDIGNAKRAAIIWVNGKAISLPTNASKGSVGEIAIWEKNVFAAGIDGQAAILWINGKAKQLDAHGYASDIFVVRK